MIGSRLGHGLVSHPTYHHWVESLLYTLPRSFSSNIMSRSMMSSAFRPCTNTRTFQNSIHLRFQPSTSKLRQQSLAFSARWKSTAKPSLASQVAATPKAAPSITEKETLPWAEYLSIRKNKRRWETVSLMTTDSSNGLLKFTLGGYGCNHHFRLSLFL